MRFAQRNAQESGRVCEHLRSEPNYPFRLAEGKLAPLGQAAYVLHDVREM